jgi:predicted AAA+ superfamily ATPase
MIDRLIQPRLARTRKSLLLLGPRQVGKSTLCRSLKPDRTINLADEEIFLSYAKDPGRLRRETLALGGTAVVFIDEIQRIPALLNTVQALLDEKTGLRFLLTGSSARKLKRGGANLLPGRIILEHLDPLTFWEMGASFRLNDCLTTGCLPGIRQEGKSEISRVLESYAQVYLREEIQAEAVVRNIGAYARFLDTAADASGDWINYSKLSSDMELPKETVRRFLEILEETLIVFRIPSYRDKESHRRLSQRDRFVFFDPGVRNALLGIQDHPLCSTEKGKLFEQWIFLQCLYYARAHGKSWSLSSYRTDAGAEVDIVLDTGDRLIAIECKAGKSVSSTSFRGGRSLEQITKKPLEKILLYTGSSVQQFGPRENAVPFDVFLREWLPASEEGYA